MTSGSALGETCKTSYASRIVYHLAKEAGGSPAGPEETEARTGVTLGHPAQTGKPSFTLRHPGGAGK